MLTTDGFFLENCVMTPCSDANTAATLLDKAMRHRKIGAHDLNSRSNKKPLYDGYIYRITWSSSSREH